jgi:WD40 repeat protein
VRRNRVLVGGTAALVVSLAAGLLVALSLYESARVARDDAEFGSYVSAVAAAQASLLAGDVVNARKHLEAAPPDRRDWEWHHVQVQLDTSTATFQVATSTDDVPSLNYDMSVCTRFHPDGRRLVSVSDMGVRIWDLESRELLASAPMPGHVAFRKFVWGPGATTLVFLGREQRSVDVWSLEPLQPVGRHALPSPACSIAIDGTGTLCAVGLDSGELLLLRTADGAIERRWSFAQAARCVVFAPASNALDLVAGDRLHRVDRVTGDVRSLARLPAIASRAIARHPNGRLLALAAKDTIYVIDTDTGDTSFVLPGPAFDLEFSDDARHLAAAQGYDGSTVWDLATRSPVHRSNAHGRQATDVAMHPDGTRFATSGRDLTVKVFELGATVVGAIPAHRRDCVWNGSSRDGRWLVSSGREQLSRLWDAETLAPAAVCIDPPFVALGFTPAGDLIGRPLTASGDAWQLPVLSVPDLRVRTTFPTPHRPNDLLFAPAGDTVFVGARDANLVRQSWPDGRVIWSKPYRLHRARISRNGRLLATTDGTSVQVLDAGSGAVVRDLPKPAHTLSVQSLVFFADDTRLATASLDQTICLWDVASGRKLATLRGHAHGVQDVDLSPDGRRLLSASRDGVVKLWDTTREAEVFSARVSTTWMRARFDHDGRRILYATSGGDLGWLARDRRPATPGITGTRHSRPEVDRLVAELEAEFGDRTHAAIEALDARPDVPDAVREAVATRLRLLPGESRALLARALRTAYDPTTEAAMVHRVLANTGIADSTRAGAKRAQLGMLYFRVGDLEAALEHLGLGDYSDLDPQIAQARLAFLAMTEAAKRRAGAARQSLAELRADIAARGRVIPADLLAEVEASVDRRK